MLTRMAIIATTAIISRRVKPSERRTPLFTTFWGSSPGGTGSPFLVVGAVQRLGAALRVHVPHVVAAPARAVGVVLVAALPPFGRSRHRVRGDAAQELQRSEERRVGRECRLG